jgi:glutamate dehydrogenase/leucine dehydrogenase
VAAKLFHEAGAKVVAVQDHRTTLFNPAGLDVPKLLEYASHSGTSTASAPRSSPTSSSGKSIATS